LTSFVEHPQTNRQAEVTNKVIINDMKKRVGKAKGRWLEELPEILWAYRCTPQSGKSPYNLTYGTGAMLPVEVGGPTIRRRLENIDTSNTNLGTKLELIEELWDKAYFGRYNTRLEPRLFREGELVWQLISEARKNPSEGKLRPNWEGPFKIQENLGNGVYLLQWLKER